ncbi:MAG: hypothetical protein SFV51_10250 [Bryobacteraceae bacterium]|nr:hypothetical protein [Bryobacteraceae bacterium]
MRFRLPAVLLTLLFCASAAAQVCRLSVAGLNRNRRVTGDISAECPDPLHTAPFGNWGASSNFGPKRNGHQFDGWCRDMRVCDNNGLCFNLCGDGWYEWNSCTTHPLYKAPNCTMYNANECTGQASTQDVNVLGTQTVDLPVSCPRLSADGRRYESGGCLEAREYTRTDNFISAYELDPITGDELIQSLYFPALTVKGKCNIWGCAAAGSDWLPPVAWDSPSFPVKVYAEMAMVVNSGTFVNPNNVCRIDPLPLQAVSSASFAAGELAADSIVSIFAADLTVDTESAASQPLPATLAGLQVRISNAAGVSRNAGLVFASPNQLNVVLPTGLPEGEATLAVLSGGTVRSQNTVRMARVSPGVFAADASGRGAAAAVAIRVAADGTQTSQVTFQCSGEPAQCVPVPISFGAPADQLVLVLFGTGIRGRSDLANVQVSVGGLLLPVQYAGAQGGFAGLDQVNIALPRALAGRGITAVQLFVDGRPANPVLIVLG